MVRVKEREPVAARPGARGDSILAARSARWRVRRPSVLNSGACVPPDGRALPSRTNVRSLAAIVMNPSSSERPGDALMRCADRGAQEPLVPRNTASPPRQTGRRPHRAGRCRSAAPVGLVTMLERGQDADEREQRGAQSVSGTPDFPARRRVRRHRHDARRPARPGRSRLVPHRT